MNRWSQCVTLTRALMVAHVLTKDPTSINVYVRTAFVERIVKRRKNANPTLARTVEFVENLWKTRITNVNVYMDTEEKIVKRKLTYANQIRVRMGELVLRC